MQQLKIGHYTNIAHGTGVTVFLFDRPTPMAYILCGASPATRELHLLDPEANVTHVDSLAFLGGSAFGLGAANGVMQWLCEQGRGWPTPFGRVPIVPAAAIYDLGVKQPLPPLVADAYHACTAAVAENNLMGQIGAGTGATVGKLVPETACMSGGIGRAEITLNNGIAVLAYAVVNSVGDVRDVHGNIVAGAKLADGRYADGEQYLLSGQEPQLFSASNTTLVALFTNAKFSKIELKRIARMASAGMARAISPVFTAYDGDIIFCASLGEQVVSEILLGTLAVEVTRQAIVNAVLNSVATQKE